MKRIECEGVGDNNGFFEIGAEEGLSAVEPVVRRAVITQKDIMGNALTDEFTIERFLVNKGFKADGGPIAPKLTGTITMTQDLIDGSYHYSQRDA
jgi:hypothetical protein